MIIPFFESKRQYKKLEKKLKAVTDRVLKSGYYVLGPEVKNFEKNFGQYIGMPHAVAVNSCTDALKIALKALGVGSGDEVITVSNTAVPTVSAIRETGAMPVFVDIDEYFTIDVKQIEPKINKKTKAVVVVHLYGGVCNMKAILKTAKKYKLKVVEDCAQAIGAEYEGKKVGTFGDVACFSFYPTKNLGALGDGGMIVTKNAELAEICRALRMYGMKKGYYAEQEGYNSRLDEIQAGILNTKLPYVPAWNKRRQEIAKMYLGKIKNPKIILPKVRPQSKHVFHLFVIKTLDRQKLGGYLNAHGIGFGIHYPYPIHLQSGYSFLKNQAKNLKITEKTAGEIVSLPIFPELKNSEIMYIIKTLNNFDA